MAKLFTAELFATTEIAARYFWIEISAAQINDRSAVLANDW